MKIYWTGGQYSLFRAALGFSLFASLALGFQGAGLTSCLLVLIALFASASFAVGYFDKLAAVMLIFLLAPLPNVGLLATAESTGCIAWLMMAHLFIPGEPYGSLAAVNREDPAGKWKMKKEPILFTWLFLVVMYVLASSVSTLSVPNLLPGIIFLFVLAIPPTLVPALKPKGKELLFYDGDCGLCQRSVRFVLAEEGDKNMQFSHIGSETFADHFSPEEAAELPDSIIYCRENQKPLLKSDAILSLCLRLGGVWRVFGALGLLIPRGLRDYCYDQVARVRKKIFAQPKSVCPLMPHRLRERFLE